MAELSGFPYFEVQFTKRGEVHDGKEVTALRDFLAAQPITDLVVASHGWNNHMDEARGMYRQLFGRFRARVDEGQVAGLGGRRFAVLAVLWPSKKFADKDLIPSGAASGRSPATTTAVRAQLDELKDLFEGREERKKIARAKALVPDLEDSAAAREEFADVLRALVAGGREDEEDASRSFHRLSGKELMERLSKPLMPVAPPPGAGRGGAAGGVGAVSMPATGGAAGLGAFIGGVKGAAFKLANAVTYYEMKDRAGSVGKQGLNPVLRQARAARPEVRLHLVGHSFGGRLVTAATLGADGEPALPVASLTLLQAAFSHHGFARDFEGSRDGAFRRVVEGGMVTGPTLITCTENDKAVGLGYPVASLIAGQVASRLGDKDDPYGGIGRNGAQKTPEASDGALLGVGERYDFRPKTLHNLRADAFISDHSDVEGDEVTYALAVAIGGT